MEMNKWKSPQTVFIIALVLLIFIYIGVDNFLTKPKMYKEIDEVKVQYLELSDYLNKKIPEIDSTFNAHSTQIRINKENIDTMKILYHKNIGIYKKL